MATMALERWMQEARAQVEAALDAALTPAPGAEPRLSEAMRYVSLGAGKRVRSLLCLAAAEDLAGGLDRHDVWQAALPFAAALELLHTYSLVHDDLPAMDDDALRRGRATCHVQYDEATAILVGDALHTLAFATLLEGTTDGTRAHALARTLARAAGSPGMVSGQMRDLAAEQADPNAEQMEAIHLEKTAALLAAAVVGGGIAVDASPTALDHLRTFGLALGVAFQIVDDVLDATQTSDRLGKTPGKDAAQDKLSAVRIYGIQGARERAEALHGEARAALAKLGGGSRLEALAKRLLHRTT